MKTPEIFVRCLAAYTQGTLHGCWISTNRHAEEIQADIDRLLKESPADDAEEWAIHDHTGFGGCLIDEYEQVNKLAVLAELLEEYPSEAVAAFHNEDPRRPAGELQEAFPDAFSGTYGTRAEYAEEIVDLSKVPEWAQLYVDLDRYVNDMMLNGDITLVNAAEGGVHVLWNHV